jgi:hypothetical protein
LIEWHNKNSELRLKVGSLGFYIHTCKIWEQNKVTSWLAFWSHFWNILNGDMGGGMCGKNWLWPILRYEEIR